MPIKKNKEPKKSSKTRYFRLLAGRHEGRLDPDVTYVKGDIIESDVDLVAMFGDNKFREVIGKESKETGQIEEMDMAELQAAANKMGSPLGVESTLGVDVTADHAVAAEAELLVFQAAGKRFNVTEKDTPNTPLNEKALTAKQLDKFLAEYTTPDDEGDEDTDDAEESEDEGDESEE